MARDPPASSISPRYPRKSIEIMALEYKTNPVIAVGPDIFPRAFISPITCTNALQNYTLHKIRQTHVNIVTI